MLTSAWWSAAGVQRQQDFMQWLTQTLVASLYPGAPYERKYLAVLLLDTVLEVWNSPDISCKSNSRHEDGEESLHTGDAGLLIVGSLRFKAFCDGFFEAKTTRLLLGEVISDALSDQHSPPILLLWFLISVICKCKVKTTRLLLGKPGLTKRYCLASLTPSIYLATFDSGQCQWCS